MTVLFIAYRNVQWEQSPSTSSTDCICRYYDFHSYGCQWKREYPEFYQVIVDKIEKAGKR